MVKVLPQVSERLVDDTLSIVVFKRNDSLNKQYLL